jgi:serine/threonine-protein kinase RsbW
VNRTEKKVSLSLESKIESVDRAEQVADQYAAELGFDEDERGRISMAVREAVVNAVYHGNAYDPGKKVTVGFEVNVEGLTVRVSDQGAGLNPETIPDPLAPENLLSNHGRGIFIMRAFMDQVSFRDLKPGTEITLVKHRGNPAERDRKEE